MPTRRIAACLATIAAAAGVVGCGGASDDTGGGSSGGSSGGGSTQLSLVAYSTPKEAYAALVPAFQKTPQGQGVKFTQSFGASGDQSRAVAAGLPADVIALSLQPDIDKLVDAGYVAKDWNADSTKGFVTDSVVVLSVRKGNPKNIKTFADLAKPGVKVLTPNPFSSGGARWNLMAVYGSAIKEGKTPAQALDLLKAVLKNTVVQDKSARDELTTFQNGKADVAIQYENEAITAQKKGISLDYVVPDSTILIENPIAVSTKSKHPDQAKAFVAWLKSTEGQKIFAAQGYRPVDQTVLGQAQFPQPPKLFKIDDLGGWSTVMKTFFDPDSGSVAKIEQGLGVSTSK